MSVNYEAAIYYGTPITEELYSLLHEKIEEDYDEVGSKNFDYYPFHINAWTATSAFLGMIVQSVDMYSSEGPEVVRLSPPADFQNFKEMLVRYDINLEMDYYLIGRVS